MFKFLSKKQAKRWCQEQGITLDLDSYALVEKNKQFYIISKGLANLEAQGLNIVHIGLNTRKLISQSPEK